MRYLWVLVALLVVASPAVAAVNRGDVLMGRPVLMTTPPATGAALQFNGTNWVAATQMTQTQNVTVMDEAVDLGTPLRQINFTGLGVTAAINGSRFDVTIPGGTFSGDVDATTNKALSNSGATVTQATAFGAVWIKDDQGLVITNAADTQRVTHTASAANTETIDGNVIIPSAKTFSVGSLTVNRVVVAGASGLLDGDANFTYVPSTDILTLGGSSKTRMVHGAGTLGAGETAVAISATQSGSGTGDTAVTYSFTSAGTGTTRGISVDYAAGYGGTGIVTGFRVRDVAEAGATSFALGSNNTEPTASIAISGTAAVVGTELGVGVFGEAGSGDQGVGVFGKSRAGTNSIGVLGFSSLGCAGYFTLSTATPASSAVALHVDNGSSSAAIAEFCDNTTAILQIRNNGGLRNNGSTSSAIGQHSTIAILDDDGLTLSNAAETNTVTITATGVSQAVVTGNLDFSAGPHAGTISGGYVSRSGSNLLFAPDPAHSNVLYCFESSVWKVKTIPDSGVTVGATGLTASKDYWLFGYDSDGNGTADALELTTNSTVTQNGIMVKGGTTSRTMLARCRTNASGDIVTFAEDATKQYVNNVFNKRRISIRRLPSNDNWTYSSTTIHQANADTANQVDAVTDGVNAVHCQVTCLVASTNFTYLGIGLDSTTVNSAHITTLNTANINQTGFAYYDGTPSAGAHSFVWLESVESAVLATFYGDNGPAKMQSGLTLEGWF